MPDTATERTESATTDQDPGSVVRAFLGALEDLDVDRALAFADPSIVYHNRGLPPARGLPAFERQMRMLGTRFDVFEARIHHLAAEGPIVLTEPPTCWASAASGPSSGCAAPSRFTTAASSVGGTPSTT